MSETIKMEKSEFKKEHANLPRILRNGTPLQRKREADKQEAEGLALRVRSKLAEKSKAE